MSVSLTVAMSVYNNGPYLDEAIASIRNQTWREFVFLIVDDGSTDGSSAIIDAHAAADPRICVMRQENRGFIASLNRILAAAEDGWIARMDGDDISAPDRLEKQMEHVRAHPELGVIGCNAYLIGPDSKPLRKVGAGTKPATHAEIVANLELGPLINHNAVLMRREPVLAAGGYRPAYKHCEDYDLWLRLIDQVRFANLQPALVAYRVYPGQVSNRHLVAQACNAAIAWQARCERLAGREDPTEGLDVLPALCALDLVFGRRGVASYVRERIVQRMLYSPAALSGDGLAVVLDHVHEKGSEARLWRATARLLRAGKPLPAVRLARALLRAG